MVINFPKTKKPTPPVVWTEDQVVVAFCSYLLDQLLNTQTMLNYSDKEGVEYWTGARDQLKNMVLKEMINEESSI